MQAPEDGKGKRIYAAKQSEIIGPNKEVEVGSERASGAGN